MVHRSRLPGAPDRESVIAHVDIDCFYAACERLREPALREEPVVVGMGYEPGETVGAVATASYEARAYGVESAQPISEALEVLPRKVDAASDPGLDVEDAGFYRPVDMDYYESVGAEVKRILGDSGDTVRDVSIDEAYLDLTDRISWDDVSRYVTDLKDRIEETVGVTASIGVAPTMSAAKVASDQNKPDGLVVVRPGEVPEFFESLDVSVVPGVGPVTAAALEEMGVDTAGDLQTVERSVLTDRFGERGKRLYRYVRGEDERDVEPRGTPKSISRESAFPESTDDVGTQRGRLRELAKAVSEHARDQEILYGTIGIKVVTPPYDIHTRARSLPGPVSDGDLVETVALELFEEFAAEPVRKLGVRVSNLSFSTGQQPSLANWETQEGTGDAGNFHEERRDGSIGTEQRSLDEF